jgi:hypothetical protein
MFSHQNALKNCEFFAFNLPQFIASAIEVQRLTRGSFVEKWMFFEESAERMSGWQRHLPRGTPLPRGAKPLDLP